LDGAFDGVFSYALLHVLALDLEAQLLDILDNPSDFCQGTPQQLPQDSLTRRVLLEFEGLVVAIVVDDLALRGGGGSGGGGCDADAEAAEQEQRQLRQQARPHSA